MHSGRKQTKNQKTWTQIYQRPSYGGSLLFLIAPQVEKAHPRIRSTSERCREDPPERQTIPRLGVRPGGAQEAHHVLHWRSRPPWSTTASHRLWAHPTLHQVTKNIIFSDGARLLPALPLARACPNTPRTPPSRPVAGLAVLLLGVTLLRRCTIEMYGWGLCVMSPLYPEIASDEGKSREHKSKGDPWPLTSLTDHIRGGG